MTFFLNEAPPPTIKARGPDILPTTDLEGIGAGFSKAQLENDSNFRLGREIVNVERDRVQKAFGIVGPDEILKRMKQEGLAPDTLEVMRPELLDNNKQGRDLVLDMARGKLSDGTGPSFSGVDLSQEGIDKEVNAKLQAEHQDQEDILAMMPSGRALAELLGGIAGITADVKNLPFLLLGGGGGSVLKILGREAAINMAAEATFMPSQFEMAKRLDIPDPNVIQNLALAGIGGAAFAAVPLAISRGIHYAKGRNIAKLPNIDADRSEIIVSAAEDALYKGEDPFEAVRRAAEDIPEPAPAREDGFSPEFKGWFEGSKASNADGTPTKVFHGTHDSFGEFDTSKGGANTGAKDAEDTIFFTDNPDVASSYADLGNPYGEGVVKAINKLTGGLYEKANEKIIKVFGGSTYDIGGNVRPSYLSIKNPEVFDYGGLEYDPKTFEGIIAKARKEGKDGVIIKNVDDGYNEGGPNSTVYVVFKSEQVRSTFDEKNLPPLITTERLPPLEGETPSVIPAEDLAAQAETAIADAEAQFAKDFPEMRHKYPLGRGIDAATERTAAGEQYVTPGVEPITQRQRLEAQQAKPLGGGPWSPDSHIGGLFDPNDKVRLDMFSDPASSEARVVQDAVSADFRDQIAKDGDFKVDLGDGKGARPASEVLADLDQGDIFSARLDLCGKGPA